MSTGKMHNHQERRGTPILMAFFAIFCLLPSVGFVIYHLATPSDGARLSENQETFTTEGLVLSPFETSGSPFREGDVVVLVEGISIESWVGSVFTGDIVRPEWKIGDTVKYEILRGDERVRLNVPLIRLPITEILKGHWGAILFAFVSQVVAVFVLLRRPEDAGARALFIWAMSGSHTYAWSVFLQTGDFVSGWGFWIFHAATPLLWLIYWPASTHVALVFPGKLPIVSRYRFLIPGLYISSFIVFAIAMAATWVRSENILAWQNTWGSIDSLISTLFLMATMVIIAIQYRRVRTAVERQQIRWTIFGALIGGIGGLVLWTGVPLITGRSIINANLLGLLTLPFPISLALAIWRYRLFDIDLIIRRTLQYSLTTILLAGFYFLGVVLLEAIFRPLTGDTESPLITVLTTLGIASLFNPLRKRIQHFIDQRFYRTRYDAEKVLDRFASTARDEVDIEIISVALLAAVDETMQPGRIDLWLLAGREVKNKL